MGEADGPRAGLAALAQVDPSVPRYAAVEAYLRDQAGDLARAARCTGMLPVRPPTSPSAIT